MAENQGDPKNTKPLSLEDIALEAYKNKDKVQSTYDPGIPTNFDLKKTSELLGAANHPELGQNYVKDLSDSAIKDKAYAEAKAKADEQGFFGEAVGALNQAVMGEIVGGTIEGIGYLFDPNQIENLENGTQSFGKMLSDAGRGLKESTQELTPIYVDPEIEGQFAPWRREWWMSNIPSVASFASILIPVAGEAKALSLVGEGLQVLNSASKIGRFGKVAKNVSKVIDNTIDAYKAVAPELNYTQNLAVKGLHRAAVSTHIEAMMEATGTFQEEYEKLKNNGIEDSEARRLAGEAASFVYKANWANLATEFLQQTFLLKGPSITKGLVGAAEAEAAGVAKSVGRLGAIKELGKQMSSEGLEEGYQFIIQEEGKYLADVQAGLTKEEDFGERLNKYLGKGELWTSAFFGSIGGLGFAKLGPKINQKVGEKLYGAGQQFLTEEQARIEDLKSQTTRSLQAVETLGKARETGNEEAIKMAENQLALNLGMSSASNGTLDYMLDRFDNLKNITPEEREKLGFSDNFVNEIDKHKENITKAAKMWQNNTRLYGPEFAEAITTREFNLEKLNEQYPSVKKQYDNTVTKLPRYTETTIEGRKLIDLNSGILGLERFIKGLTVKKDVVGLPNRDKIQLQEDLENYYKLLDSLRTVYEETEKTYSPNLNAADKLALSSLEGKFGEDLAKAKSEISWYDYQFNNLTNELVYLTSKKGREQIRKAAEEEKNRINKEREDQLVKDELDNEKEAYITDDVEQALTGEEMYQKVQAGELTEEIINQDPKSKELYDNYKNGLTTPVTTSEEEVNEEDATTFDLEQFTRQPKEESKVITESVTNGEYETPSNEEQFFGVSEEEKVELSIPNSLAWKSVYNEQSASSDKTEKNKAISNFLENPTIPLNDIELRFSIDFEYLNKKIKGFEEINFALNNKRVPRDIGKVPIKVSFYKDNKPVNYSGFNIELNLHDDSYGNFREDIKEVARQQIRDQKTQIVEGYFKGDTYTSKILNKGNGHILTAKGKQGAILSFPLTDLFKEIKDIEFSYGSNKRFLNPETKSVDSEVMGKEAVDGALYAKVKTANNNIFPLRLHTSNLNESEAELVYLLYRDIVKDDKVFNQNISQDIIDYINNSNDNRVKELTTYLNPDNLLYKDLLDELVFNGYDRTNGKGASQLFARKENTLEGGKTLPAKLVYGNAYAISSVIEDLDVKNKIIKHLTENRRRQLSVKRLTNPEYKKYIVNNSVITSNAKPNEASRLFIQPTISFDTNLELLKQVEIIPTKEVVNLEAAPTKEFTESLPDEIEGSATDLSGIFDSILNNTSPIEKLPSEKEVYPNEINKETSITEEARKKALEEARKQIEEEGDDSVFKLLTPEMVASSNTSQDILGDEIDHIRNLLPSDIAITVENDYLQVLNNGSVAVGLFKDNGIYLSKNGPKGTAYHEAFHAVFRTMLTNKELSHLYDEAARSYYKYTEKEIKEYQDLYKVSKEEAIKIWYEEQLADDFADYMVNPNSKSFNYSKGIKGFFQRLLNWIKNIFSNKSITKKLFDDIALGKYKNKPVHLSRGIRYKALIRTNTDNTYDASEVKEITQQLSFIMLAPDAKYNVTTDVEEIKSIRLAKVRKELNRQLLIAEQNKDTELQDRIIKVFSDFTFFIKEVENYNHQMGFSETEETAGEDSDGNILYKPSYETSGKEAASKNIKFLIALTPKFKFYNVNNPNERVYDTNSYLKLPKFENFGETWNKLERILLGTVPVYKDGELVDSFDIMMDKLLKASKYHPELGYIRNKLLASDTHVKTQFHFVFSRYKGIYVDALISGNPDGNMTYVLSNSDSFSKEKEIASNWAYNFRKNFGVYDSTNNLVYNPRVIEAITLNHIRLSESINNDKITKQLSGTTLGLLNREMKILGIDISDQALKQFLDDQEVNPNLPEAQQALIKIENIYIQLDNAIQGGSKPLIPKNKWKGREGRITDKNNHILDEKFFHTVLAGYESNFRKVQGENTIIGPGGTTIWASQDNNLMSKIVSAIKAGDLSYLEMLKQSPYHQNSLYLKQLLNNKNTRDKFEINLYNNYKDLDASDSGDKAKDLKNPDKINDTVNKYLQGTLIGLAEADKSQQYYLKGFNLENSQVNITNGALHITGKNPINILFNYFVDEVNRMETAFRQLETLDPEKQIIYYHYGSKPGDGKGNWNKSYLFPNMDLERMGIIVKNSEGKIIGINNTFKNKLDIEKYILDKFLSTVQKDLDLLTEYSLIEKSPEGVYKNKTIDHNIVKNKYNDNIVSAIGDYTLNSLIANIEFTKLFTQDPALYKKKGDGFEDFRKRIPAIIASGKDQRIFKDDKYQVREFYNSATIENIISPSQYFLDKEGKNMKIIAKATGQSIEAVKEMFKAYLEVNETDAQAWITIDLYRERMVSFGKWTEAHEDAFNRIKEGKELSSDVSLFAQPLKTIHAEVLNHYGTISMQYNKQSEAVLLPTIARSLNISNILEAMEAQKLDHIITLDGKKVGATGIAKVRDEKGNILNSKEIKFNPIQLSNRYCFLQQDLPTKKVKDVQVGSQAVKNVLAMLKLTNNYDGLTGLELYNQYHEVISALSDIGLVELQKDLGFDVAKDKITDEKHLRKSLIKNFNGSVSNNIINALNSNIYLDSLVQIKTKIQNKIAAMTTKKTVKLKQLGAAMIQTSSFGYNSDTVKLTDKVKDNIIWFKDPKEELQPARLTEEEQIDYSKDISQYNNEFAIKGRHYFVRNGNYEIDGESASEKEFIEGFNLFLDIKNKKSSIKFNKAQILIPHSKLIEALKETGKNYKDLTANEIKALIDPSVLEGVSYRIPNQGPPSNDAFEIVGILPPEMGDTIVAYKEITVKTGSDFDIDKAYLILPNFKYNKNTGKIEAIADNSKQGLQNRRLKLMISLLSDTSSYTQLMRPLDAPWLKDLIVGSEGQKGLIQSSNKIDDLYFFTGSNQALTKSLFDGAKSLVGVIAKHMTHHNLSRHENVSYRDYYIGKGLIREKTVAEYDEEFRKKLEEKDEDSIWVDKVIQTELKNKESRLSVEFDEKGNSVEESLIAYANAIVDAAKDPFILKANINQFTAATTFMLIRAGVDREWVSAFMLQPILVDLVREMDLSEGRISEESRDEEGNMITALDKVLTKYKSEYSGREFKKQNINLKEEDDNIKLTTSQLIKLKDNIEIDNPDFTNTQKLILGQFLEWQSKAKQLGDLMNATASDTDGATKNDTTATMKDNLLNKVVKDGTFNNLDKLIGYTLDEDNNIVFNGTRMIGTYHKNSVNFLQKVSKQLFIGSSESFKHSINNIARYAGHKFLQDEDIAKTIENELFAAVMSKSNIVSFKNKELLNNLLYTSESQKSLAERIIDAKTLYPDNDLIQALNPIIGNNKNGEPSLIALSPKSLDVDGKNNLYLHWEDLLAQDKQLGEDLIVYSYYASGFSPNFGVFFEHIPSSWLMNNGFNDFIENQLHSLNTTLNGLQNFEDQVFRHLYKNNKIVPTVNRKALKQVQIEGINQSDENFIVLDESKSFNLLIGENEDGEKEYKSFVKIKKSIPSPTEFDPTNTESVTYLYKLLGYKELVSENTMDTNNKSRELVYVRTNTLGYNKGTNIIKEYGSSESLFKENNVILPEYVADYLKGLNLSEPKDLVISEGEITSKLTKKSDEEISNNLFYCLRPL